MKDQESPSVQLRHFLSNLAYYAKDPNIAKHSVFSVLYWYSTHHGSLLPQMFPHAKLDFEQITSYTETNSHEKPFYRSKVRSSQYTHPPTQACARPLYKGEPVYRCVECGLDNTCVLCVHCFNEQDHVGHTVQMYISSSDSNGVCDCGDPEAFPSTLHCKCQNSASAGASLDPAVHRAIASSVEAMVDYVVDVMQYSIGTLPVINGSGLYPCGRDAPQGLVGLAVLSRQKYGDRENPGGSSHQLLDQIALASDSYANANKGKFRPDNANSMVLVLWNDENHNFPEATYSISQATFCSERVARKQADKINALGRDILFDSTDLAELVRGWERALGGGMTATITTTLEYWREEIAGYIVEWLLEVLSFDSLPVFRDAVRLLLARLLVEPSYELPNPLLAATLESWFPGQNLNRQFFNNGVLVDGKLANKGLTRVIPDVAVLDLKELAETVLVNSDQPLDLSRIQYLLVFSHRFKTSIRKIFPNVFISPLLANHDDKLAFSKAFVQIYPQLLASFALSDREEHLSVMHAILAQIMTFPTCIQYVLSNGYIGQIIGPLVDLLELHAGTWNHHAGYPNLNRRLERDLAKKKPVFEALVTGIHDIKHLVSIHTDSQVISHFYEHENLSMLILLLRNFQEYWPITRKYGNHVEVEVLDFFVHLQYSDPILNIAKIVGEADVEILAVQKAVRFVLEFLLLRPINEKALGIAEFVVSNEPVSLVHPIHSFLSYMIQSHDFSSFIDIFESLNQPFMKISDISLRSIVLAAQIKIGFWIRNGSNVSKQATLYMGTLLLDTAYARDVHINQLAVLFDNPNSTFYNFLDRWELFDWYTGDVDADNTKYEERFGAIVEKFIVFIYNILVDRGCFIQMQQDYRLACYGKKSISYCLSEGPKPFSKIEDLVDLDVRKHPEFTNWLLECADYQPPTSLDVSGMYRLKPKIYDTMDPYYIKLDLSQSQEAYMTILKHLATSQGKPLQEVVVIPSIVRSGNAFVDRNIGNFVKTNYFAKFVYKLLQVSIDKKDETYLGPLLHLLLATLIDDEEVHGSEYVSDCFVNIPISDLLLNISESLMSKHLIAKAEYILEFLIERDQRVTDSLIDCFGKEHVDDFLARKTQKLESEAEKRKKLASQRADKVMKKFAKQRKKFLDKNQDLKLEIPGEGVSNSANHRTCVLCGETENESEVFGVVGCYIPTDIPWKFSPDNSDLVSSALLNYSEPLPPDENVVYPKGYTRPLREQAGDANIVKAIWTCGHGMHVSCFDLVSSHHNKFYSCPLCHSLLDTFLPNITPPDGGGGLSLEEVSYRRDIESYEELVELSLSLPHKKSESIIRCFTHEAAFQPNLDYLREELDAYKEYVMSRLPFGMEQYGYSRRYDPRFFLESLDTVSQSIGTTIKLYEASSRLDGDDSYINFIDSIPGPIKSALKGMIQTRGILFHLRDLLCSEGSNSDIASLDLKLEKAHVEWTKERQRTQFINEVIRWFFETEESFGTVSYIGYIEFLTFTVGALTKDANLMHPRPDIPIPAVSSDSVSIIENLFSPLDSLSKDRHTLSMIFTLVEKSVLPFLRQLLIFKDLLTSKTRSGSGNVHESTMDVDGLVDDILSQDNIDSPDPLCRALGFPTVKEMLFKFVNVGTTPDPTFEYRIYKHYRDSVFATDGLPQRIFFFDFPGVMKLIDLPKDYNTCLVNSERKHKGSYDNYICLQCGLKVVTSKYLKHDCSRTGIILFHPSKNIIRISLLWGEDRLNLIMPGPYLTVHGEVKSSTSTAKATLSEFRYKEITKLWFTLGIYGLVSRHMFGRNENATTLNQGNNPFTQFGLRVVRNRLDQESSEEEDDEDYINEDFVLEGEELLSDNNPRASEDFSADNSDDEPRHRVNELDDASDQEREGHVLDAPDMHLMFQLYNLIHGNQETDEDDGAYTDEFWSD